MKATPLKAIRLKCIDCTCGQIAEVRACTAKKCPLWVYRMGHRPKTGNDTATNDNAENPQKKRGILGEEGAL